MQTMGVVALVLAIGCGTAQPGPGEGSSEITSVEGAEYTLAYDSFVYVAPDADDEQIKRAIRHQVKSSLGALREQGIGILDRDARSNLEPSDWQRTSLEVISEHGELVDELVKVTFHYRDTAVVDRDGRRSGPLELTLLAGDYGSRYDELVPACTDDDAPDADSLWYHYHPSSWACQWRIRAEESVIAEATQRLADPNSQLAAVDRDRLFVTQRATLIPVNDPPVLYPEYDRLWGFRGNASRTQLVVYAFFGVDKDLRDPADNGLREYLRFVRTLRSRFPALRVTHTSPHAMLLDYWHDDTLLEGVDYDEVESWILDDTGYPEGVDPAALRQQVIERFSGRWIYWELPVTVSDGTTSREMTVQIRSWYGQEDGSAEIWQQAQWRYLEAFWHGDVFAYTGHSHFGHGPLAPWNYHSWNFPDRYQVMLVNSCLSFNYYDQDFLELHPNGSADLDMVTNGLSAYWRGMGAATGGYVASLIDGTNKSWAELLVDMRVDLPWRRGYDPMRVVNGELDNAPQPQLTVSTR